MARGAYYNEIDPFAAQWLRNLIAAGHIAPGEVDERSIVDVRPAELRGFAQCHFFAGIGVWSYAMRRAGVRDDDNWWSGSCPCQPFSAAGGGAAFGDERDLWPAFRDLIRECRPRVVVGEQVASALGLAWLDLVHADLEAAGYACGAVDTCAAGFGAPHIRQRLYFVAHARSAGVRDHGRRRDAGETRTSEGDGTQRQRLRHDAVDDGSGVGWMADDDEAGRILERAPRLHDRGEPGHDAVGRGSPSDLGNPEGAGLEELELERGVRGGTSSADPGQGPERTSRLGEPDGPGREAQRGQPGERFQAQRSGPGEAGAVGGFWANAEWIPCRDGKARPVESGTFPLAHGIAGRVGRLRAYGNAINAEQARGFLEAVIDVLPG